MNQKTQSNLSQMALYIFSSCCLLYPFSSALADVSSSAPQEIKQEVKQEAKQDPKKEEDRRIQETLNKINTNVQNTESNVDQFKVNLQIIDSNIGEIGKAKTSVENQKIEVKKASIENTQSQKSLEQKETELKKIIQEEQASIQFEIQKIEEMEKMIATLKSHLTQREANVADYQLQMQSLKEQKELALTQGNDLKKIATQLQQKSVNLLATEAQWKTKKRTFDTEMGKWQKELDRQKKIQMTYNKR
jgi:hypothetical protein